MTTHLKKETVLHADETAVQVLHEPNRAAQTKSYMWLYRTSGFSEKKIVIYEYTETRKRANPERFLEKFEGYLHTDGYEVYHGLSDDIIVVGCFAHLRRYFEKAYNNIAKEKRSGTDAQRGLDYIRALFALEKKFAPLKPEERYEKRLLESKPIFNTFFEWVATLRELPKSLLGEAVYYAVSQRKYLRNIYLDGRLELSNNRAERSIKPFVIGRKNWLFSNTPDGAAASAVMYSIIETAKENRECLQ